MAIHGITWLECPNCGVKEWLNVNTPLPLGGCPQCGFARHAVDNNGRPVLVWSTNMNPTNWNIED